MDKSLVVRTKKYLWHYIDPLNNHLVESDDFDNQYGVWNVICDSLIAIFIVNIILILACVTFKFPTGIIAGAYIIPIVLSIDYIRQKDVALVRKLLMVTWLLSNIFVAISMANNSWTWFFINQ